VVHSLFVQDMTDVTEVLPDLLKRIAPPVRASLLILWGSAFYTASANALTVDAYQRFSPDADVSAPAGDANSLFNAGAPAQDPNSLPSLGSAYYKPASGATAAETKFANTLKQFGEQSTSSDSQDPCASRQNHWP